MSDIVKKLRETAECADYVVDRETAAEAADEIEQLRRDIGTMLLEREEAKAEAERLRAGGCARDQGLTQYCAEAAEKDARMQRMALKTGQLSDEIARLRAALTEIRDAGPMTVDDQRWRVAKDALENSNG